MRRLRPDRLLRGNALSAVQVGFEVHFAGERERFIPETRSQSRVRAVTAKPGPAAISQHPRSTSPDVSQ